MRSTFADLGLAPWVCDSANRMGMRFPTPIQCLSVPQILEPECVGLVARAKTGSGKTAAFTLPILHQLSKDPYGVFALILTPNRELAYQILDQVQALGQPINIQAQVVVGGKDMMAQALQLTSNPHVIVATPGRLADHLNSATKIRFTDLQYLVLDEADRLMESCFDEDLATIYAALPPVDERITLLFSATLSQATAQEFWTKMELPGDLEYVECNDDVYGEASDEDDEGDEAEDEGDDEGDDEEEEQKVDDSDEDGSKPRRRLTGAKRRASSADSGGESDDEDEDGDGDDAEERPAKKPRKKAKRSAATGGGMVVKTLDQKYLFVPQAVKEAYLAHLMSTEPWAGQPTIIFTSTCRGAELIAAFLEEMKIDCVSMHSRLTQDRRLAALGKFRGGFSKILVATDLASRGLDIPTVKLVINYDVPRVCEDYVHRVGRTARAGLGGMAISFVSQYDVKIFQAIEAYIQLQLKKYPVVEKEVLELLKKANEAKKLARLRLEQYAATNRRAETSYHRQKLRAIRQAKEGKI